MTFNSEKRGLEINTHIGVKGTHTGESEHGIPMIEAQHIYIGLEGGMQDFIQEAQEEAAEYQEKWRKGSIILCLLVALLFSGITNAIIKKRKPTTSTDLGE